MNFCIQDPSYSNSKYLHEALLSECVNGLYGGGAYAFASKDGIELLFEDESFKHFLEKGKFCLIVGTDDITNLASLDTLKQLEEKHSGHFVVKAYVHNGRGSSFHPKYSWFKKPDGGVLVIGSGNLTQKGLRYNREAYSIVDCDETDIGNVEAELLIPRISTNRRNDTVEVQHGYTND